MGRKLWSTLAILSATLLALVATVSQPMPAAAASTGGSLFGLSFQAGEIVKLDPSTGQFTVLTTLPVDPSGIFPPGFFGLASDAADHKLFTVRATYNDPTFQTQLWQVVTIDSTTGATSLSPAMSQGVTVGLAFDPSSGQLFGLAGVMSSNSVVRVDPTSGAVTHIADLAGLFEGTFTFAPALHVLYLPEQNAFGQSMVTTVDVITGAISESPALTTSIIQLVYDTGSGKLFGKGAAFPSPSIFEVDPTTGVESVIGPALGFTFQGITVDPVSHNIYLTDDEFGCCGLNQFIETINDQTGVFSDSTGTVGTGQFVGILAFEGAAVTPASVRAEVQQAFASGLVQGQGVESAILSELDAATAARARGQCATAERIYSAVINTVQALSSTGHTASGSRTDQKIDPSFGSQLISDLNFLIGHCP